MPLGGPLLEALERMRYGGIILNGSGEVLRLNSTAERYLRKHVDLGSATDWTGALRRLLGARKGHSAAGADLWAPIVDGTEPQLILYSRRVENENEDQAALTVVTLVDLTEAPQPSAATLEKLFGLTAAEARLAVELARGLSLSEAAKAIGIKMSTGRTQLSSIFAKTATQRQGELVALLARLAILP